MSPARYDRIGANYASQRREDPAIAQRIWASLGDAQTVVNVGAGSGSYEPPDLSVIPVEPSGVMAAQREVDRPAIRGVAQDLPLHDNSVDAAMAVLSLHHWHPDQRRGVEEMCRVARNRIVLVTIDAAVSGRMWLMADYLTEVRQLDDQIFPTPTEIVSWMDGPGRVEMLPVSRDTPDHNLMSFWAHPERVLNAEARAATSGFARQPDHVVRRVVEAVRRDLADGTWDSRYGHLRERTALDVGLRLVVGGKP